jgi:ectoine hydroxylase-related dioxygenase (phytanoyl-CoA dioxygenase family)
MATSDQAAIAAAYARDGYWIATSLFSPGDCETLKAEALRVLREHAPARASVYVGAAAVSPRYRELADDPRVVDILRVLMPDGVMFMSDKFVFKSAQHAFASPWHIDAAYWRGTRPKLSAWIPLDDARADNGTLLVVRGSHRREWTHATSDGQTTNNEFNNVIPERQWPASDEVTCAVPRGSAVFFSDRLVHGSCPNTSGEDRYTIISTYHAPAPDEEFDRQFAARHVIVPGPATLPARV